MIALDYKFIVGQKGKPSVFEVHNNVTSHSKKILSTPLLLKKSLRKLRDSEEAVYYEDLIRRVIAVALYRGFDKTIYAGTTMVGATFNGNQRMLYSQAFFHQNGQVLAVEQWKSYAFANTYKYDTISFYPSLKKYQKIMKEFQMKEAGEKEEILEFLEKNWEHLAN